MAGFGDQLQDNNVVDYRALAGSMDGHADQAWDPFCGQNNLALQPPPLEVGRCIPAPAHCDRDWPALGPFDLFQNPELYPEQLCAGDTAFSDNTLMQRSHTMPASCYTVGSPEPCLASPSVSTIHHTSSSIHDRRQTYPVLDNSFSDAAREDAQEDRRQRNTAASARFRIKKRLRGEALENSVKKEQIKIARLEADIVQLEIENKWLRGLLTEKMEKK